MVILHSTIYAESLAELNTKAGIQSDWALPTMHVFKGNVSALVEITFTVAQLKITLKWSIIQIDTQIDSHPSFVSET